MQHDDEAEQQQRRYVEPLLRRPVGFHLDADDFEIEIDPLFLGGAAEDDVVDDGLAIIDNELETVQGNRVPSA